MNNNNFNYLSGNINNNNSNNNNNNNNNITNKNSNNKNKKEPIAIIGIGCRFPGNVSNYSDFVNVIKNGSDCLTKIPGDRWNSDIISRKQWKLNNRIGGYLNNIEKFDNGFFGISPKESQQIDPQQRLLLHLAIETLEDGRVSLDEIKGKKVGVFIGSSSGDYLRGFDSSEINQFTTPGTNSSFLSNRLSYFLDVNGPSMTVNTACSASMVAIHLGLQSLWNGESELSIVGGVNIISSPLQSLDFGKAGLLNQEIDGRCYSFDPRASGYVRSEGGGLLLLKPLSAALRDNDEIYSLLLNSGNNSNGKTPTGITSPRSICQEKLIEQLLKESSDQFSIDDIGYFECHGTGTQMGDLNEITAIGKSIGMLKNPNDPLIIGSVKASIGHLEGASGICGVIKSIICLKEKILPQQCKFSSYNPKIPFESLNLKVLTKTQPWNNSKRICGVNSFGVGGSNSSLFLSSFDKLTTTTTTTTTSSSLSTIESLPSSLDNLSVSSSISTINDGFNNNNNNINNRYGSGIDVITLSVTSPDKEDLKIRANDVLESIKTLDSNSDNNNVTLRDISNLTNIRTSHFSNRVAIIGDSIDSIKLNLQSFINGDNNNKSVLLPSINNGSVNSSSSNNNICFIFSGQGQQWHKMVFDLYENNETFRNEMNNFSKQFELISGWSIIDKLYSISSNNKNEELINETWLAQPSIVAIQYSLIKLFSKEIGIEGSIVLGHSLGELMAAYYCGIISDLEDLLKLLYIRSILQNKTNGSGRMHVCLSSKTEVEQLISQLGFNGRIVICGNNTSKSCTISGDNESMNQFTKLISSQQYGSIVHKEVRTNSAFHSHQMDMIKDEFFKLFNQYFPTNQINTNDIGNSSSSDNSNSNGKSFYSTCYGKYLTPIECKQLLSSPNYWWKNIRESVLFKESIEQVLQNHPQCSTFIEITCHPILNYFLNQLLKSSSNSKSTLLLSTFSKNTNSIDQLLTLCSKLYVNNLTTIKWNWYYDKQQSSSNFKLPGRRWKLEKYWIENCQRQMDRIKPPMFISLDRKLFSVTPSFEVRLNQERFQYLNDHQIQGIPLVPFSFYIELVYASIFNSISTTNHSTMFEIENFTIDGAILIDQKKSTLIGINFNSNLTKFEIGSINSSSNNSIVENKWKIHSSGTIKYGTNYLKSSTPFNDSTTKCFKSFNSIEFYSEIIKFNYNYKSSFQCIKEFKQFDKQGTLFYSEIQFKKNDKQLIDQLLSKQLPSDFRCIHPCLLDAVLQSAIIPATNKINCSWIPIKIGKFSVNIPSNSYFNFKDQLLYCLIKPSTSSSSSINNFLVNIQVFDKKNNSLICELTNLEFKGINSSTTNNSTNSNVVEAIDQSKIQEKNNDDDEEIQELPLISEYVWCKEALINQSIKFTENYQTVIFCSTNLNGNDLLDSIITSALENGHDENKIFIVSPPPVESDQYNNRIIINYTNNESDFDALFAIINSTTSISGKSGLFTTRFIILPNFNSITFSSGNSTPLIANDGINGNKIGNGNSISNSSSSSSLSSIDNGNNEDEDMILKSFNDSNLSLFHLQKSIIKNNIKGRLFLITNGGQSISQSSSGSSLTSYNDQPYVNLPQYQLIGQIRVFSNEYPIMECSMIDIQDSTSIDLIVDQLNSTKLSKLEIAFRDNIGYSYQLLKPSILDNNSSSTQTNAITKDDEEEKEIINYNNNYYRVELSDNGIISDLKIKQFRQMKCGVGQVLVRVEMCALNFRDILKSLGRDYDPIHLNSMGDEFSGKIIEIGEGVNHLSVGQYVFGINMSKSMGSFVCCNSDLVFPIPSLSIPPNEESTNESINSKSLLNQYCTIPIVFLTSWYSIIIQGRLKKGERILIHSGCGGVGLASIQISKMIGAEIHVTVGSNEKKQYLIKEFGIDENRIYSSRSLQFYNDLMVNTDGEGVDMVLNSLSGEYLEKSIQCLSQYGRFIEIGKKDIYSNSTIHLEPFKNNLTFFAVDIAQMTENRREYLREIMIDQILPCFENGSLKPLNQHCFNSPCDLVKAIRFMSSGNHIGKILINWSNLNDKQFINHHSVHHLPIQSFSNRSTYMFTGFGGVSQTLLKYYSTESDLTNVIIVSKNGLEGANQEKLKLINQLKESGLNVMVEKCDLTSIKQVYKLFNKIYDNDGGDYNGLADIKGIFHLASMINDKRILKHNMESFNYVYNSKAISAWNLHQVSLKYNLNLDHFQTIGSVITVLGNIGQSNYTCANRFVEGLTHLRVGMGLKSSCIHLASVPEVGMASNDHVLNDLNSMGFTPFQSLNQMNLGFKKLFSCSSLNPIIVLGEINVDRFIEATPNFRAKDNFINTSLFNRIDPLLLLNESQDFINGNGNGIGSFDDDLNDLEQQQQKQEDEEFDNDEIVDDDNIDSVSMISGTSSIFDSDFYTKSIRGMVCDILELKDKDLNNTVSFSDYGLDSLLSSELSNTIQKNFSILIPSLTLVDNSTINSTVELIKNKLKNSTTSSISSISSTVSKKVAFNTNIQQKQIKQQQQQQQNISTTPTPILIPTQSIIKTQKPDIIESLPSSTTTIIKPLVLDNLVYSNNSKNELTSPPPSSKRESTLPIISEDSSSTSSSMATVIYEISPIAAPHHRYQTDVLKEITELTPHKEFIDNIYKKSKIRSRYCFNDFSEKSMADINKLDAGERVAIFREQTYQTVINAGKTVIERAGIDPMSISHVVGVTSTGIMAPSFDVVLIDKLGLSINTSRTMINFMGCGAAINSMRAATAYAKLKPGTFVLVVAVEASATCMKFNFDSRSDLLSQAIFTDGCVASLITCQPRSSLVGKLEIVDDLSYLMPESRDALNLFIGATGIDLDLRPELPVAINRHINGAISSWLKKNSLHKNDIEFFATHPGGAKIIAAVHEGLGLSPEDLSDSYEVMKRYGNMIGVSTYYVLRRILDKNETLLQEGSLGYNYGMAMAFSPGASIEAILFKLIKSILNVGLVYSKFDIINITPANKQISYPENYSQTQCAIYKYILVKNTTQGESINSINPASFFLTANSDSVIYYHYDSINFGQEKQINFTINGMDTETGYLTVNYICKEVNVSLVTIDIIQQVMWSDNLKYSSIVRLNGVPDESTFPSTDGATLKRLGNSLFLILYKEVYYTKISPNQLDWDINLQFTSNQVLKVSVPLNQSNIGPVNNVVGFEVYKQNLIQFNAFFGGSILFKSNSSIQRPIYSVLTLIDPYYLTATPISGVSGNITYYVNLLPLAPFNQSFSLYSQNEDLSFKVVYETFVEYTSNFPSKLYSSATIRYDNSSSSIVFYTGYFDNVSPYDFRPFKCKSKGSFDYGINYAFPYGFVSGNNLNSEMGVSIPMSPISTKTYKFSYNNIEVPIDVFYTLVDLQPYPYIISVEKINLYGFKFIVVINAADSFGIKYMDTSVSDVYIRIGTQHLVNGDNRNGFWEFLHDGVNLGTDSTNVFSIENYYDVSQTYIPTFPFSITNPDQTLALPEIKLSDKINFYSDIKDITFKFNNVHVTNQSVDNIMYFTFNNIENYKDLSIGFSLNDPKTLKDINYQKDIINLVNTLEYTFAQWDETNSRFSVMFKMPANVVPGVLDWSLTFSRSFSLLNTALPDQYQLKVISENIDIIGPIVTKVVKKTPSDLGTLNAAWLLTIEDDINGLLNGYITIMGVLDSSLYNVTISPSTAVSGSGDKWKADYLISIPLDGSVNNYGCIAQDYRISEVKLIDSFGNTNRYFQFQKGSGATSYSLIQEPNPFYLFDDSVLVLSVDNTMCSAAPDTTGPKLTSFQTSKTAVDVGSRDRSITFDFVAQDLDSGLKDGQYPIVYLTSQNLDTAQCVSTIVSKTATDITYTCTIEVPLGFAYPLGFTISVYGFINNGGYYSGFPTDAIKAISSNAWYVSTSQYSMDIPIITSSTVITNQGGDIWLSGRGFNSVDSIKISYSGSNVVYKQVTNNKFNSALLVSDIIATNDPFTIELTNSSPSKQSNVITITPVLFFFNYTDPIPTTTPTTTVSPTVSPTETPTPTSTVTPTKSPIPTNPPQKCQGNPECGGENQGACTSKGCLCFSPWFGLDCSSKYVEVTPPLINGTGPSVEIPIPKPGEDSGSSTTGLPPQIIYKSLVSVVSLRELDFNGKVIKTIPLDTWEYTKINETISRYDTTLTIEGKEEKVNVTTVMQWFDKSSTIVFAGQQLKMNPSSIKFNIDITSYPFSSALNQLQLVMSATLLSSGDDDVCSSKSFGDTTSGDDSNFIKLQVDDHSVYGRFLKRAIVDDLVVSVDNVLLDDSLNTIESSTHTQQSFIGINIPHYSRIISIDPDFSLLIDQNPASKSSENSICSNDSGLSKGQIAGIVIGATGFAAVVVVSAVYSVHKTRSNKKMVSNISKKMESMK
ncbi:hypothetical protein ACTFIU_002224 [Dictyostelium citrinum]